MRPAVLKAELENLVGWIRRAYDDPATSANEAATLRRIAVDIESIIRTHLTPRPRIRGPK